MSVGRLCRHVVRLGLSVLVAGALVGVAGCTGSDPAPTSTSSVPSSTTTTPPPPTTTSSPRPTTDATELPAAAMAHTPAGAEAFVHYFNDQVSRAWMTPDVTILESLCLTTSKACSGFQDTASLLAKQHQHFDRVPLLLKSVAADTSVTGPGGSTRIVAHGTQNAARVLGANGSVVDTVPKKAADYVYYTIWVTGTWKLQEIKLGLPS